MTELTEELRSQRCASSPSFMTNCLAGSFPNPCAPCALHAAAADRLEQLEALIDPDLTIQELEAKMKDGTVNLSATFGDSSRPVTRWIAGLLLHAALGEGEYTEEPPNYSATEIAMTVEGQTVRAALEVIKPGGRSSHEIRTELEAEVKRLRGDDA